VLTGLQRLEAQSLVDKGSYACYTTRLIEEPAFVLCSNTNKMRLPKESYLWVPMILNSMGGANWAEQFVPALPSQEEMHDDGAPNGWSPDDLVAAVREVIWGESARIHLRAEDITSRGEQFVYFKQDFQEKLSSCLQNTPAYNGALAWMEARFNRARERVFYPMHNDLCPTYHDNRSYSLHVRDMGAADTTVLGGSQGAAGGMDEPRSSRRLTGFRGGALPNQLQEPGTQPSSSRTCWREKLRDLLP
jgi:hypothetical protein